MKESAKPAYELRQMPDGSTGLVATERLTSADFDAIRTATGAPLLRVRKIGFVAARRATGTEHIETHWNGKETSAVAQPGDWVVTNMSPQRTVLRDGSGSTNTYVIKAANFPRLYRQDDGATEHGAIYRAISQVDAFLLPGRFEILAPWGEMQRGARGYLVRSGSEIYGNHRETFEATYEPVT